MRAIERRAYLRVPDNLHVEHVVVSAEEYKKSTVTEVLDLPGAFDLRRELYRLELEARDLTREIAENDRKMGSYFHNLNQRIELLATAVMLHQEDGDIATNAVDISPAGASYLSDKLYPAGSLLALKLIFLPSQLGIASFGQVSYCLLGDNDLYRIGVQFTSLDSSTEALLERHIAGLQADARRQRLHGIT